MLAGFNGYTSANLDFRPAELKKAYIVASSFRSGSTHLSISLWETGVLGAPCEYFNYDIDKRFMFARLGCPSPADYYRKLITCRTSKNGIFGVKAHYLHFAKSLVEYPPLLEILSPLMFIYINRRDKIAQAVSMARALQTNVWLAFQQQRRTPLFYSREFIQECLREVYFQVNSWKTWFEERGIEPLVVNYETLLADKAGVVQSIVRRLGAENDDPEEVVLPKPAVLSDGVNAEWIRRFREETGLEAEAAE